MLTGKTVHHALRVPQASECDVGGCSLRLFVCVSHVPACVCGSSGVAWMQGPWILRGSSVSWGWTWEVNGLCHRSGSGLPALSCGPLLSNLLPVSWPVALCSLHLGVNSVEPTWQSAQRVKWNIPSNHYWVVEPWCASAKFLLQEETKTVAEVTCGSLIEDMI